MPSWPIPGSTALTVVEAVAPVIDWQRRDLLPDTAGLAADPRCSLVHDSFFALVAEGRADRQYDAVLVDIDHTPRNILHPSHAAFYTVEGLGKLATMLTPDGVFGLWSDDPPDADFEAVLAQVFSRTQSHVVTFANPLTQRRVVVHGLRRPGSARAELTSPAEATPRSVRRRAWPRHASPRADPRASPTPRPARLVPPGPIVGSQPSFAVERQTYPCGCSASGQAHICWGP